MKLSVISYVCSLVVGSLVILNTCNATASDPLLVVVLMVKNEESVMASTLQPFADAGINAYLVLDTGSRDKTIENTYAFFESQGITQGYVEEQPFVDFATSRNYALTCAEQRFPHATFFLMIDAEWHLYNAPELITFCNQHTLDRDDSYLIRIADANGDFYVQRLIRAHKGVRFVGVVHETLDRVSTAMVPAHICFRLHTTDYGKRKSQDRWKRDCALLLKEYDRDPGNARTLFYLAQTYACLGDLEQARIFYEKRCALPIAPLEETFIANYRLGQIWEELNDWDKALHYYLQAYEMRPGRIEPLIAIARYYLRHQQFELSFLFARRALDKTYPDQDYLFVEKDLYDFVRYDIVGHAAWYTKDYEIGEAATRQALQVKPELVHLYHNLLYYLHRNLF